jgi:glycosyltransferase involved in cell wall biosynthesis
MRILFANDGLNDPGGVHAYLQATISALEARGHEIAVAHCTDNADADRSQPTTPRQYFRVAGAGRQDALGQLRHWAPSVCFSHNMHDLSVDRDLMTMAPVVKFMHGYFGTCLSGLKTHRFPRPVACDRAYGAACLALYFPRRCGQLSPTVFFRSRRWAEAQRPLLGDYAAVVVASRHMRDEYVRSGANPDRTIVNALFATRAPEPVTPAPAAPHVVFLGRMTSLKGGDLLLRSIPHAAACIGQPIRVTMIGDGPQRSEWEDLALDLALNCRFTGWVAGEARWPFLRQASVVALPGIWPEPFGLVGLEAGSLGVPAVATGSGGVTEWLQDGRNGVVVPAPLSDRAFGEALGAVLGNTDLLNRLRAGAVGVATEMSLQAHVDRLESILSAAAGSGVAC